jgi:hypothetical protein
VLHRHCVDLITCDKASKHKGMYTGLYRCGHLRSPGSVDKGSSANPCEVCKRLWKDLESMPVQSVLSHLFLLLFSHLFLFFLSHPFLRHGFFHLLILFVLFVLRLLLSNTWLRQLKWFAYFHRTYLLWEMFAEQKVCGPFSKLHPYKRNAIVEPAKTKPVRADSFAPRASTWTGTGAFALEPQKNIRKAVKNILRCSHPWLCNPCPQWEHALGQRPVINRFTADAGKTQNGASISKGQRPGIIVIRVSKHLVIDSCWFNITNPYQVTSRNQLGEFSVTGIHVGRLIKYQHARLRHPGLAALLS